MQALEVLMKLIWKSFQTFCRPKKRRRLGIWNESLQLRFKLTVNLPVITAWLRRELAYLVNFRSIPWLLSVWLVLTINLHSSRKAMCMAKTLNVDVCPRNIAMPHRPHQCMVLTNRFTLHRLARITCCRESQSPYECVVCVFRGLANDKRQLTFNQSARSDCARTKALGLVRDQRLICKRNPDLMLAVAQAARDSVDVCQELFADRRWNCSTVQLAPNYLPDLASST